MLCHSTTAQCYLLFLIRTTVEVTFWKNPQAFLMSGENLGKRIMELVYRWEDFKESLSIVALPILHGNVIFWTSPWKFKFNTKCIFYLLHTNEIPYSISQIFLKSLNYSLIPFGALIGTFVYILAPQTFLTKKALNSKQGMKEWFKRF